MSGPLVLSLFPGIGLLDMAFEEEGFCVVRGPDLLWGGDVKRFHPPAGKFDGVIGGPPCKGVGALARVNRAMGNAVAENLIPEFERVVAEAEPTWFLMENVPEAPLPHVLGYFVQHVRAENRWAGGVQQRERRFSFGHFFGLTIALKCKAPPDEWAPTVVASAGGARRTPAERGRNRAGERSNLARALPLERRCELQGLPAGFLADAPFTREGKAEAIGNGVPLPLGRAIARAVREATGDGGGGAEGDERG